MNPYTNHIIPVREITSLLRYFTPMIMKFAGQDSHEVFSRYWSPAPWWTLSTACQPRRIQDSSYSSSMPRISGSQVYNGLYMANQISSHFIYASGIFWVTPPDFRPASGVNFPATGRATHRTSAADSMAPRGWSGTVRGGHCGRFGPRPCTGLSYLGRILYTTWFNIHHICTYMYMKESTIVYWC